jgi:hypothetical protein
MGTALQELDENLLEENPHSYVPKKFEYFRLYKKQHFRGIN